MSFVKKTSYLGYNRLRGVSTGYWSNPLTLWHPAHLAHMRSWDNAVLMLDHRLRRWATNKTTMTQQRVFTVYITDKDMMYYDSIRKRCRLIFIPPSSWKGRMVDFNVIGIDGGVIYAHSSYMEPAWTWKSCDFEWIKKNIFTLMPIINAW